ncbi:MAG: asparaginyl/glutamyl-tRNA amidotransferase subunit C [Actinobacteria bacterium RBG_19FT_COMBO_54_7]|uniref:Aspartyl/glutamyl-tRNA(Asn/Gln) amidotransferase subunit C n=1 Tax=Candidatus Solincola sediminis TaxID=1797199 RepID=A0A1F2WH69_9ACTN|nr:MAG: asparaginyl/glutamyl-tRNA amidotransferase subunit C [Candidatus Solincola sediminis]OFW60429.1 MAG: asparaginyl/glutamyl-tRNA amidotransferase subunit C [Candidatus Solincola sediminis]OFW65287.1 MAG: asparaginyl/glutamyl-tRNA amidotransferase subunit C [Actinobacteria bacterium RBG_19FT_COMBO_54_7]
MIDRKDVEYVAWLARLDLSEEEKERFTRQLDNVLEHAQKIKSLDTSEVEPTPHVLPLKNVMRDDEIKPSLSQEEALSNAPHREGAYFVVPRIL